MTKYRLDPAALGFETADQLIRRTVSTGIPMLDELLDGGLEYGLVHLFYGDRKLHRDILKIAVHSQLPYERGGMESPCIIIDSTNMIDIDVMTDHALELGLEPEKVMDRIFITRAFNSSQTYDLVMNQLEQFFEQVPARLLIVTGLPNLYLEEGMTGEKLQQLAHMSTRLKTFTLSRGIVTVITAPITDKSSSTPAGGRALTSNAQIHIQVIESRAHVKYTLRKHPSSPVRHASKTTGVAAATTPPLSYFLRGLRDEE